MSKSQKQLLRHGYPNVLEPESRARVCPTTRARLQAAIESLNGRWQAKAWARFQHESLAALQAQSVKYVAACRNRAGARMHRLARCEVDLDTELIHFYALRRRDPDRQPLLRESPLRASKKRRQRMTLRC